MSNTGSKSAAERQVVGVLGMQILVQGTLWLSKVLGLPLAGVRQDRQGQVSVGHIHYLLHFFMLLQETEEMPTTEATSWSAPQVTQEKVNSWSTSFLKQYHILPFSLSLTWLPAISSSKLLTFILCKGAREPLHQGRRSANT